MSDKGVVAVLDPRPATACYGGFPRASLPPFWTTYDPEVVRAALKRLDAAQTPLTRSTSSSRYSRTAANSGSSPVARFNAPSRIFRP